MPEKESQIFIALKFLLSASNGSMQADVIRSSGNAKNLARLAPYVRKALGYNFHALCRGVLTADPYLVLGDVEPKRILCLVMMGEEEIFKLDGFLYSNLIICYKFDALCNEAEIRKRLLHPLPKRVKEGVVFRKHVARIG